MNLSKSEKLLAAKKKLREFQLNKMMQDDSAKQSHPPIDLSSSQCQNAETNKLNIEVTNNTSTIKTSENNIHTFEQDFQINEVVSTDSGIIAENIINHEKLQNSLNNTTKLTQDMQEMNLKLELEKKIDLNDFPKVQKEHLLEMASAVADVLTNEPEHTETSLDSDLMCRNQFLSSYLEEQRKMINDLHIELSNAHSRVSELETNLEAKETEFQAQLAREVNPLKEQLQVHTQTTGILIAEKAELSAALSQAQQSVRQSSEEAKEMMGKLKNSQIRIVELEKEMSVTKNSNEDLKKSFHQLQNEYDSLDKKFFELKKEKEDSNLEVSELKQKLNLKKTELIAVQQELQEKTALLSLSELRIQQMKGATPTEEEKHAVILLEQELAQTKESLKVVNTEKDEANKQYQNYVKQLDAQQTKLLDEIKVQKMTIEDLQEKEQSYVQRLSELEQLLQQEKEKVENLLPLRDRKDQLDNLLKNIDELTLEQEKLHIILSEKDSLIEILTKDINDLREVSNQEAEVTKLATALESEQLGASRAVHQNRQLKEQLTDMENAFVSLSNAKLDLTEQLQAERSIGRKLNAQLNNVETELEQLKEKLKEKELMLHDYEKERFRTFQLADQMQYYQAQSHHADTFQRELQHALVTIERLEKEKRALAEKLKEKNQDSIVSEVDSYSINASNNESSLEESAHLEELKDDNVIMSESVKQLEQRFKETMERVAELTEEKQKLEHLVLQLQSETDTIGEYIALYQIQRAVLQNRAREREQIFRQLLEQRNQQQEQLHKLKVLVSDFLKNEFIHSNGTECLMETDVDSNDSVALKSKKEIIDSQTENKSVSEILDVLTEIKDCKDSCMFEPNFHPCPWCSGKLLTV
ncbi:Golgin subfamily A member 2 [Habropoda laboriosa]|uniref:Golgin subfamily A member 2 n=1 Tax=Habropoda laboriosa TaxID=597456 RepID=A0A0L7RHI5_9HYME|nr:PREDICTED: golgin subfamily A member 2-like [Habropoda laboriosa]KOC70191.1 Golgin subfamily A member 2 [Habropoda laboriosa]